MLILYNKWLEVAKLHTKKQLKSLWLHDGNNFPSYIIQVRLLWQRVNSMGRTINNALFCIIILSLLSTSCNPIMAILYTTTSSINTLIQLDVHWLQISNYGKKRDKFINIIYCFTSKCLITNNMYQSKLLMIWTLYWELLLAG